MKKYNVAILGATGVIGVAYRQILAERNFPVNHLSLLTSKRSVGKTFDFRGEVLACINADTFDFHGVDIVFGAVSAEVARIFAPRIIGAGAVFIDNSSGFRMDRRVPLVIPEINPEDAYRHEGIIANPNCSTIIAAVALSGIQKLSKITTVIASTYQAVSGAGADGIAELAEQNRALLVGEKPIFRVFPYQIAENLIPQIGSADEQGYTSEEMKMQNESRKIMHLPELVVTCTCVRVPVVRSHAITVVLYTEEPVSVTAAREAVKNSPGCVLYDDIAEKKFPMPLLTSFHDEVYVGRIRQTLGGGNGLTFFCCGDQIRKGAATNAIQIAELLLT